jgi:hypothetical protein
VELYSEPVKGPKPFSDDMVTSNSVRAFLRSSSNESSKTALGSGGGLSGSKKSTHISAGAELLYSGLRSSVGRVFEFRDLGVYSG